MSPKTQPRRSKKKDLNEVSYKARIDTAKQQQIRTALFALVEAEKTVAVIRRCLESESPGFPIFTNDLAAAGHTLTRCMTAYFALCGADSESSL